MMDLIRIHRQVGTCSCVIITPVSLEALIVHQRPGQPPLVAHTFAHSNRFLQQWYIHLFVIGPDMM